MVQNTGNYFMSQFLVYETKASLQRHTSALVVLNEHGKGYFSTFNLFSFFSWYMFTSLN